MSVEGGSPSRFEFFRGEQLFQALAFLLPVLVPGVEDLRQPAPADVTDQHPLLILSRRPGFAFETLEQFDGGEVGTALLLQ